MYSTKYQQILIYDDAKNPTNYLIYLDSKSLN